MIQDNMTLNELIAIFVEKFRLRSFKVVGIDKHDILWSSKTDNCGITWNFKNRNMEFFSYGHKVGFINYNHFERGLYKIDAFTYGEIVDELIISLRYNNEIKEEIEQLIDKYITGEYYEEVVKIKDFKKLVFNS